MYKCNKCDKSFKFKSHLERHINNKTPCNKVKEELSCIACNINFKCNAEQLRHEKSKKHINNYKCFFIIIEKGRDLFSFFFKLNIYNFCFRFHFL